jgi:GNAT superfamily N-acetyltransferase
MEPTEALLAAHRARFAAVDPLLPPAAPTADGQLLTAATADGTKVAAKLQRRVHGPGDVALLWEAADVWQLFPYFGDTGTEGLDLLLRALRSRVDRADVGDDSSCLVAWPSRDAEAIRAFLDHGFVPMTALAIRTTPPPEVVSDVTVRRAGPGDFKTVLALAAATFEYAGLVAAEPRPDTARLLTPALRRALDDEDPPVWLAERDGVAQALAHCAWVESTDESEEGELLPPGRWGYVNNVATMPEARGSGLGQALMAHVHREFHAAGTIGTYLYYNPPNPLSSVFWHRQGYRPLWTMWEVRPASALR